MLSFLFENEREEQMRCVVVHTPTAVKWSAVLFSPTFIIYFQRWIMNSSKLSVDVGENIPSQIYLLGRISYSITYLVWY